MAVSTYNNNNCRYRLDKLDKVVYLINEDAAKNIYIDNGEAYVSGIDQEPLSLRVYNIALTDEDAYDERFEFTHTLRFSVNGYANYEDFGGRYYVIVKSVDNVYWLVNPLFPCKVTYTYTLDSSGSHTDFTLSTVSNFPLLRIVDISLPQPSYECKYTKDKFDKLHINETQYSLYTDNNVKYTNDSFKDIVYIKNTKVLRRGNVTEEFADELNRVSDNVICKKKADAFASDELISYLNSRNISEVELIGIDGNSCIKESAKGAVRNGFAVSVVLSCTGIANPTLFVKTKEDLEKIGVRFI